MHLYTNTYLYGLTNEVALSWPAFANHFTKTAGQTMYNYLTQIGIMQANELLNTTNLSLYEVANLVG